MSWIRVRNFILDCGLLRTEPRLGTADCKLLLDRIEELEALMGAIKCPDNVGGHHRFDGDGQCKDCCNYATDMIETVNHNKQCTEGLLTALQQKREKVKKLETEIKLLANGPYVVVQSPQMVKDMIDASAITDGMVVIIQSTLPKRKETYGHT